MHLKKFFTKLLVLVIIFCIFIYTFHNTIMAFSLPTIHCDLDFEALINHIINSLRNLNLNKLLETLSNLEALINHIINSLRSLNLNKLMITLSNLEYLQELVGVPQNGYDINNTAFFIEMLFQAQDLYVEFVDGVFVNCIRVNNVIYTVHPDFISFIINLFIIFEFIILLLIKLNYPHLQRS